jgi:divalent metal cation (Fe/Co/Zn/Cd) transporter
LSVGAVLMVVAVAIMIEVKGLIVGESADPEQRAAIEAFIAAQPEVAQVFKVITLAWGERIIIAVKARMAEAESISGAEMVRRINVVEERIQAEFRSAHWVFFEPDVK